MRSDQKPLQSFGGNQKQGVGLVLSGGGAKGAYQAGVLRALNDMQVPIGAVSGASIGALNGAIVAAAPTQEIAARHLQELWNELAHVSPLRLGRGSLRVPAYLVMLASFGTPLGGITGWATRMATSPVIQSLLTAAGLHFTEEQAKEEGLLSNHNVQLLIDRYMPADGLPNRLPLYVSVYPTQDAGRDLLRVLGASFGVGDTRSSEFLHIQSLPIAHQKNALLASAALPLLYSHEEIRGTRYTDGGQGGWRDAQGNTPITPLLETGFEHIVVTHLEDGSLWNRHKFPNASVIEIRPAGKGITRNGGVRDVLGFDNALIPSWMEQGYEDTLSCIGRIKETLDAHAELARATKALEDTPQRTRHKALADAMRRLNDDA